MTTPTAPNPTERDLERDHDHDHWPTRLPRSLVVPETTLWFNLEVSARRYPNKAACIFLGRSMSYGELHRQAEQLAGWLQSKGVARGDRVLLYLQNSPQFLVAFTPCSAPMRSSCR